MSVAGRKGTPAWSSAHAPTLQRLRAAGHDPKRFRDPAVLPWGIVGAALLLVVGLLPMAWPDAGAAMERIASLLALFYLLGAVGAWFRMGRRALVVAAVGVALLYGAAVLTSLRLQDIFLPAILVGFLLFLLAGFNLLFILEEMVYDAHRLLRLRGRAWAVLPIVAVAAIAIPLWMEPAWTRPLGTLRVVVPGALGLLAAAWATRGALRGAGSLITREAHLLVAGGIAGAALADTIGLLRGAGTLVPSLVAYTAVIGTWIYISFTTLQRAQYFMRADDAVPWIGLLLSSSFAVLAHVHDRLRLGGDRALVDVVDVRVAYMVLGVWIGLAFFILRGLWRLLQYVRDDERAGRRTRRIAARSARVTEQLLGSSRLIPEAAFGIYRGIETIIPGHHHAPEHPDFVPLDPTEGAPVRLDAARASARIDEEE